MRDRYETVRDWFEALTGECGAKFTPEWNVYYYSKVLEVTKHTVSRKKVLSVLKWWSKMLECEERARQIEES